MSEMADEMLFSLWPDQYFNKPPGLDWLLKDQQFVPVPVVLLDDGRFAFKSDDGLYFYQQFLIINLGRQVINTFFKFL